MLNNSKIRLKSQNTSAQGFMRYLLSGNKKEALFRTPRVTHIGFAQLRVCIDSLYSSSMASMKGSGE